MTETSPPLEDKLAVERAVSPAPAALVLTQRDR